MDRYSLPTSITIGEKDCQIDADYRNILKIFEILSDPDLLEQERILIALEWFYIDEDYKSNVESAISNMFLFMTGGNEENSNTDSNKKPLYSWEQDFPIIVTPVNKVLGYDVRGVQFLHWWTFLSAFMEIGECTFNTFVSIRDKLNRNKRLEKHEERIYKENRDRIVLKKKHDSTTQSILDEIMGKG